MAIACFIVAVIGLAWCTMLTPDTPLIVGLGIGAITMVSLLVGMLCVMV